MFYYDCSPGVLGLPTTVLANAWVASAPSAVVRLDAAQHHQPN